MLNICKLQVGHSYRPVSAMCDIHGKLIGEPSDLEGPPCQEVTLCTVQVVYGFVNAFHDLVLVGHFKNVTCHLGCFIEICYKLTPFLCLFPIENWPWTCPAIQAL